jgi:hypothetical protein
MNRTKIINRLVVSWNCVIILSCNSMFPNVALHLDIYKNCNFIIMRVTFVRDDDI